MKGSFPCRVGPVPPQEAVTAYYVRTRTVEGIKTAAESVGGKK
jgi:hypothetical protein